MESKSFIENSLSQKIMFDVIVRCDLNCCTNCGALNCGSDTSIQSQNAFVLNYLAKCVNSVCVTWSVITF